MNLIQKIENVFNQNPNEVFTIKDLKHLGNIQSIYYCLKKLILNNKIIKMIRGFYTKAKYFKLLNEFVGVPIEFVLEKIQKEKNLKIVPFEDWSLNILGLDNQVPSITKYKWNGYNKIIKYGNNQIILNHTSNRFVNFESKNILLIIQALLGLGKNNINEKIINKLIYFCNQNNEKLNEDFSLLPKWMVSVLNRIKKELYNEK